MAGGGTGKGVELSPTAHFWQKAILKDLVREEKVRKFPAGPE